MKTKVVKMLILSVGLAVCCNFNIFADELQDSFITDLSEGLKDRWAHDEDEDTMTNSELIEYRTALVHDEYDKLERYRDETFENSKFGLMADAYIEALELQLNSLKYKEEEPSLYEIEWSAGYNMRAELLPDFVDHYGLEADEELIQEFRDASNNLYSTYTTVTTTTSTGDPAEEIKADEEIEVFNDEGITVTVTGMDEPTLTSTKINFKVENLNHHDILVSTTDYYMNVNGNTISSPLYAEVKSGKTTYASMEFYSSQLADYGIDKISEISFAILISDANSYDMLYKGSEVTLSISDDYKITTKTVYNDAEQIQHVQELLNRAGYDCGTADGVPGKKTNTAILQFERDNNMQENTDITPEIIETLEKVVE